MLNISFMYNFKACTILYQDRVLKVCIKILLNFKSILSLGKNVKVGKSSKSLNFYNLFGLLSSNEKCIYVLYEWLLISI